MTTSTIDATIFASSHPHIAKRTSISALIVSCLMLTSGVIAFVSTFEMEERSSTLSMGLMVLGTALFLIGIFRLFWKSKQIVYLPTGSVANEHSFFFDLKYADELTEMVEAGDFSATSAMKGGASGNLRLDVILSEDRKFAAVQLFQFVPYTYNPITPVRYYTNGEATSIAAFLAKCKSH